jgi:perosamine synthetase
VVPLAQPVLGAREEELDARGHPLGPAVARADGPRFERAFAAGSAPARQRRLERDRGLHLALRAVGVEDGDEVVTSPFSFVASANVIAYERRRPVFADIDPVSLNLDPDAAAPR